MARAVDLGIRRWNARSAAVEPPPGRMRLVNTRGASAGGRSGDAVRGYVASPSRRRAGLHAPDERLGAACRTDRVATDAAGHERHPARRPDALGSAELPSPSPWTASSSC